jgi:hypothetical protein
MIKKSNFKNLVRETMVGENRQRLKVKGTFEYMITRAELMLKRVEPRNIFRPFIV